MVLVRISRNLFYCGADHISQRASVNYIALRQDGAKLPVLKVKQDFFRFRLIRLGTLGFSLHCYFPFSPLPPLPLTSFAFGPW